MAGGSTGGADLVVGGGACEEAEEKPFICRWCYKYGLSDGSAALLLSHGFNTVTELINISSADIKDLGLTMSQSLLLRGALLQFRENDVKYAEKRSRKFGLPVEKTLFLTKAQVMDLQTRPVTKNTNIETYEELTEEELVKRRDMRRRLRKKKQKAKDGVSLAEQILNQRRTATCTLGSEVSLMSVSSGSSSASKTSSSTLPASHVTDPDHIARLRETRSAENVRAERNEINKSIAEILCDDNDDLQTSARPCLKSPRPSPRSLRPSKSELKSPPAVAFSSRQEEEEVAVMDAALDKILTEISSGFSKEVKNPKGDLKVAMDILENDILTEEEKKMLEEKGKD